MAIKQEDFDLLREYIKENCGIQVGDEKSYLIESRLAQLLMETGCLDFRQFYLKAKSDTTGSLRDKIVDAMTTNETLWFRDEKPWTAMREVIIPEFIQQLKSGSKSKIRVWSAASSTGQEPYSFTILVDMLVKGMMGSVRPEQFEIVGTDISPSALFLATAGRYNQIEIKRGLEENIRQKYFTNKGPIWTLNEDIRKRVQFKKYNLQDSFTPLGKFDMVLCRNVAIYFSDVFKRDLFKRISQSLVPNGLFFLGASESLMGYSTDFEMNEYKNAIYYRKK